jgi:hypothetical protein
MNIEGRLLIVLSLYHAAPTELPTSSRLCRMHDPSVTIFHVSSSVAFPRHERGVRRSAAGHAARNAPLQEEGADLIDDAGARTLGQLALRSSRTIARCAYRAGANPRQALDDPR